VVLHHSHVTAVSVNTALSNKDDSNLFFLLAKVYAYWYMHNKVTATDKSGTTFFKPHCT